MANLNFHVVTLFPEIIESYTRIGVLGRALEKGLVGVSAIQLRDFTTNKHRTVDDAPFGGGAGMIQMPEPIFLAVEKIQSSLPAGSDRARIVLMTPHGSPLTANNARNIAAFHDIVIICGHYGGVDERIREHLVDVEISTGDFVVTGGELPGLLLIDAASRFVPGVVGKEDSVNNDSFEDSLLGAPQFTRPSDFRGMKTPDVLLSGNHAAIEKWRRERRLERTFHRRPDLLEHTEISGQDIVFLRSLGYSK